MTRIAIIGGASDIFLQGVQSVLLQDNHEVAFASARSDDLSRDLALFSPSLVLIDSAVGLLTHSVERMPRRNEPPRIILLLRDRALPGPEIWLGSRIDGITVVNKATRLMACVNAVAAGGCWLDPEFADPGGPVQHGLLSACRLLSPREQEVVRLIRLGLRNKEIARRLSISEGTIKMHVHHISSKLGAQGRAQIAALANADAENTSGISGRLHVFAQMAPQSAFIRSS